MRGPKLASLQTSAHDAKGRHSLSDTPGNVRVLFLTPYFRPYLGGIERAIEGLAGEYLNMPEVEQVGVLTTKYAFPRVPHPDWADTETTDKGIEIMRLSGFPRPSLPIYSVPLVWFSPLQIRNYVKQFDPTVMHFVGDGWFWGHLWCWWWGRKRIKTIFTPSFHVLPWKRQWLRTFNVPLCRAVDSVVALTSMEREQVGKAYRVPKEKLSVIGWGVHPPALTEKPPRTEESKVRILCVGRLGDHKGQMWLLEVYRRARERFTGPAELVLVGRDEGREREIRSRITEWGFEDEVLLAGEASDEELGRWYAESDVFALYSEYEAFGLVYFEALANGLPVLTNDVGANRELLVQGCMVTPKDDQETAVEAMVSLVENPEMRKILGEEGRKYALSHFSWPVVAKSYLELYRSSD